MVGKKSIRNLFAITLVIGILMVGVFCTVILIMPIPPSGQKIIWETPDSPNSLDPHMYNNEMSEWILYNIYETLVWYDLESTATDEPIDRLAEEWSISSDRLNYTFMLRDNVIFHDGTSFNASCVKYNFERILAIYDENGPALSLSEVLYGADTISKSIDEYGRGSSQHVASYEAWSEESAGIVVLNDLTVRFRLTRPFSPFLSLLSSSCGLIISPSYVEIHGGVEVGQDNSWLEEHACGTGPYLVYSFTPNEEVELCQFEAYWDAARFKVDYPYSGAISTIVLRTVESDSERVSNLETTLIDGCYWPRDQVYSIYNNITNPSLDGTVHSLDSSLKVWANESTYELYGIGFNCNEYYWPYGVVLENPFHLVNFRKAISNAINYDEYIRLVLYGLGSKACGPIPDGLLGDVSGIYEFNQNMDDAVQYWNEAMDDGLDDILANNSYHLTMLYPLGTYFPESPSAREIACELISDSIVSILNSPDAIQPSSELTIDIDMYETFSTANRSLPIRFIRSVPYYLDPYDLISYLFRSDGYITRLGLVESSSWNDSLVDSWINESIRIWDSEERIELYHQIQNYAIEYMPFVWFAQVGSLKVMTSAINGYRYSPVRSIYFYVLWKSFSTPYSPIFGNGICYVSVFITIISLIGLVTSILWMRVSEKTT